MHFENKIRNSIREIPDFPKPGISFKDIMPLLQQPFYVDDICQELLNKIDLSARHKIVAIESRGFIFGSILSNKRKQPLILVRKQGKLPGDVNKIEYGLEYGKDVLEIQKDALLPHDKVVIIDDVLATGGSLLATCKLVESLGAKVDCIGVVIELTELKGRELLSCYDVHSIITY